jgi:hypothetical protein
MAPRDTGSESFSPKGATPTPGEVLEKMTPTPWRALAFAFGLWGAAVALAQPGPPSVPIGDPALRPLGVPGDRRPPLPDYAPESGGGWPGEKAPAPIAPGGDKGSESSSLEKVTPTPSEPAGGGPAAEEGGK